LQRVEGTVDALRTPIGDLPYLEDLDLSGLESRYDDTNIRAALEVDPNDWTSEIESIEFWYATIGGNKLPDALRHELGDLKERLAAERRRRQDHALQRTAAVPGPLR
jgi:phosphoenolpyruvate carboxykinase (GTP)